MKTSIYAFSGDPITYGHVDIIKRAASVFDEVIVGIGINPAKKYMFSLKEREDMANKTLEKYENVIVKSFEGLLVDYAYENNVNIIIKGVRNSADFDYENILHQVGESQKLDIDTHILFAKPELAHISSSMVKGVQKEHGDLRNYITPYVKQKLEEKMSNQYIIGITGEIGAGKSYVANKFVEWSKDKNLSLPVHNIELDHIAHQILTSLNEPAYERVRENIAKTFGKNTIYDDGTINRKILGEYVFSDNKKLKELNSIMKKPLRVRLRKELKGKEGIVLLNAALIAESDMSYMCNNNVMIITADKETQKERLKDRNNYSEEQIKTRLNSQYDYERKLYTIHTKIEETNSGKIWTYDNSKGINYLDTFFDEVISHFSIKRGIN